MRRRALLALFGGAAAAWPLAARSAETKRRAIGFLLPGPRAAYTRWIDAFVQRLRELGWVEGEKLAIMFRSTEGAKERLAEIAAEIVALKVDVIVTSGAEAVAAVKQLTSAIPVMFAATSDPVAAGLVASLAHPGGNITGLSAQSTDYSSKSVGLLREVVTGLQRVAILTDAANLGGMAEAVKVQIAARTAGLQFVTLAVQRGEEISSAIDGLKSGSDAVYCVPGPLASTNRVRIITSVLAARLPTIYGSRDYVDAGGLMSYGPDIGDLFRRAADYVDKIFRGTKPADTPVEQPTKFYLFINLTTTKAIGLTVPESILLRADDVIE
jgi:putative ABC transport system substrate-binding protein